MEITINIPEELGIQLEENWGNLSQRTLEALAIEAYRVGVMTLGEVQKLLKFSSRWETEDFLRQSQAYLDYTESDLGDDRETLKRVLSK